MFKLVVAVGIGLASAFNAPASMQQLTRASVSTSSNVEMFFKAGGAPKKGALQGFKGVRPLSPKSNYPSTSNIQKQANGFGSFVQKFQKASGKSKYGVPIFLPNGNVNPAYLAAERAEARAQSTKNTKAAEAKRKSLISKKSFELADYVRKKVGEVGSGKDYYQSGR
ncbi:hypothetical protein Ctob_013241 [Chrysochromulina tobinii]|jgi:hypothetical protein|uniref:Uncharacterized protein n=1 Tax=Chrysochromulina tobinii TaxID=1460289 RepID=A0A0M0K857_9EUKA|nr:hypothetical protein Ctob_013241 [Chrysochromulina tobinii]|eukprot:KOO34797.1 hypothetical protein Ctob_013241 [Chrysochromulina sp. CCMP291]